MNSNAQTIKNYLAKQFHLPEEQIEEMLPTLLNTLKSHMNRLQDALANSSPLQIGKMGHTIKGAFLNLGLKECAEIAQNIEVSGKEGNDQADYQKMFDELCVYVDPILKDL
jgi:HPt (histidine-containing phosphotransfer) domain-containing protein